MYTDLIKIEHPAEAEAGSVVTIQVYIKNQHSEAIYIAPLAVVNEILQVAFTVEYCRAEPGITYYFTGTFIMPNTHAVIRADSMYWGVDEQWHKEDFQTRTVMLAGVIPPEPETLEVDITPAGTGHVTTDPASDEGKLIWYSNDTGKFPHGTIVKVTAVPATGYVFDHWSDEIVGGVSYENPSYVQPMTEHRAIKAHFVEEAAAQVETLRVDVTPEGKGHVITDPASVEGTTEWHHGTTGTFPYGIGVQVTAHPSEGYRFEKWSAEIVDGISYANPAMVQDMTEHRAVKCHFREITVPPDGEGITEVKAIHGTGLFAGTEKPIPVAGVEINDWFKIKVTGVNPSAGVTQMGLHYVVTKSDGSVIENTVEEAWPYTGSGESHTFMEPGVDALTVDQVGDWNLYVELLGDGVVLDTWEGLLFSGVTEPAPGIIDMIPMLIMVMIMSMMMNIMPQLTEEVPKLGRKAWEAAKEVAPVVAKKAAKKLLKM